MAVSTRTELGRKIKAFVTQQLAGLVDRRRVTGYGDDGLVETMSLDPADTGDPVPLAQLRHVRASPGDDVVTLGLGGRHVIIGALGGRDPSVSTVSGGEGQQVIPIVVRAAGSGASTDLDIWYQTGAAIDVELPPGTWEFSLTHHARMRRSVNSGRVGIGIQFGSDYRYAIRANNRDGSASDSAFDLRDYLPYVESCVHRVTSVGETIRIYGVFGQFDTAGKTWFGQSVVQGMAIRVS